MSKDACTTRKARMQFVFKICKDNNGVPLEKLLASISWNTGLTELTAKKYLNVLLNMGKININELDVVTVS